MLVLGTAYAATVSTPVGVHLKAAQDALNAQDYQTAKAEVDQADQVPIKMQGDQTIIDQFRRAVAITSGDISTPEGAKSRFAQDYNAGRYTDVIADAEALRKFNELDAQAQLVVGQAYYKAQDYAGCITYTKNLEVSETGLALQARCAYELGDFAAQLSAIQALASLTNKPEYQEALRKLDGRPNGASDSGPSQGLPEH